MSFSTNARLCSGAKVNVRANSEDDLFFSSGGETQHVSRSELAAGVVMTFSYPGILSWGCSHCKKLKVRFEDLSVSY